jgi:hypothetical protein
MDFTKLKKMLPVEYHNCQQIPYLHRPVSLVDGTSMLQ